jgi:hypothetical protein
MILAAQKEVAIALWDDIKVDDESEYKGTLCLATKLRSAGAEGTFRVFNVDDTGGWIDLIEITKQEITQYNVNVNGERQDV